MPANTCSAVQSMWLVSSTVRAKRRLGEALKRGLIEIKL